MPCGDGFADDDESAGADIQYLPPVDVAVHERDPPVRPAVVKLGVEQDVAEKRLTVQRFADLESISFDYAVMERAPTVHVVESDFPWDDVGAWDALQRTLPADKDGNVVAGSAAVFDSRGCIVYNDAPSVAVGVCGLEDVVVVVTESGVLVCHKDDVQRVREIGRASLSV